jgi:adenylate cyclase class 2
MTEEIEAKFILDDLEGVRDHLLRNGGQIHLERHLERNWRFDTAQRSFTAEGKVLRVRQATQATITYKESGSDPLIRSELEFGVENAELAGQLFLALGFESFAVYEKQREVIRFEPVEVMLDQLPFGAFIEIEGNSLEEVREVCQKLGLDWQRRVPESYLEIFQRIRRSLVLNAENATFAEFEGLPALTPADLELANGWQGGEAGEVPR